jgi:ABC-type protease/lipase transport system fused ATPase/permease subunit
VSVREAVGPALWLCVGFSLLTNLLMLVSPIYMLQIYDRVLVSGSSDTLIWLSIIAVFLLLIYAAAESGRRRVMTAGGARLEQALTGFAFERFRRVGDAQVSNNLNAISRVNQLFSGQSLLPLFDLPCAPLFLALLFFMHPILGAIGLAGAAAMMGLP